MKFLWYEDTVAVQRYGDPSLREPVDDLVDVPMGQGITTVKAGVEHSKLAELIQGRKDLFPCQLMAHGCMPVAITAG
jgi:hypothetical protein